MTVHDEIKAKRLAKGWSMAQLALEISRLEKLPKPLTWQTVQQWENGKSAPKRTRIERVMKILESSPPVLNDQFLALGASEMNVMEISEMLADWGPAEKKTDIKGKETTTNPPSLESALQVLGKWIESSDDLQRDQVRPLINRMFDEPKRSPEIVARISTTVSAFIPSSKKVGNEEMPSFLKPK